MASIPAEAVPFKPSFAKVAASAYVPKIMKEPVPVARNATHLAEASIVQQSTPVFDGTGTHTKPVIVGKGGSGEKVNGATDVTRPAMASVVIAKSPGRSELGVEEQRNIDRLPKTVAIDESSTQLSSSDGSAKPPSIDGKSVASGTTYAMDEKESLRPDDSASTRAGLDEEDVSSAPGSVVAGSRFGSDHGARAFSEQLHEISAMGPLAQRDCPPLRVLASARLSQNGAIGVSSTLPGLAQPIPPLTADATHVVSGVLPPAPDEKLLEALRSPKDRVWVLKLEQDVNDFMRSKTEDKLSIPQCNSFYRMLAHRLADYYMLEHTVDSSMTSVQIFKTAHSRLPPPLSAIPIPSTFDAAPSSIPARRIMRRGDDAKSTSGTNTTANSEGPSKTTSEAGGESGSDLGQANDSKSKAAMTREEREAKYKEARQRIFGHSEETESGDAAKSSEEKDPSRSSSAAGKKKGKKQRNYDDDGFEARSQFNPYYGPPYVVNGYSGENGFYGAYPPMMSPPQYPTMDSTASTPMMYGNDFSPILQPDVQSQYSWSSQGFVPSNYGLGVQNFVPQVPAGYDMNEHFQRGMQSFQTASASLPSSSKMSPPQLPSFPEQYRPQSQPMNQSWPQSPYDSSSQMAQQPFMPAGYSERSLQPSQAPSPIPYPYGQLPGPPYQNGRTPRNQHPVPGSFNRQQFNPQSQAFVPGTSMSPLRLAQTMPSPMQPMTSTNMGTYGNYAAPNQIQRPSPPSSHLSAPNTQRIPQTSNAASPRINPNGQPLSHPLPQPPKLESSIAKWGTPAHLPPKPPPPASTFPEKFLEFDSHQSLPEHHFIGMNRMPSGGSVTSGTNGVFAMGAGGAVGLGKATGQTK